MPSFNSYPFRYQQVTTNHIFQPKKGSSYFLIQYIEIIPSEEWDAPRWKLIDSSFISFELLLFRNIFFSGFSSLDSHINGAPAKRFHM